MSEPDLGHLQSEFRAAALLPDAERSHSRPIGALDRPPHGAGGAGRTAGDCRSTAARTDAECAADRRAGHGQDDDPEEAVRENAKAFDRKAGVEPQPVLYVLMPELPTEHEFFGQVFAALGTPAITYHMAPRRRETAFRLLRECGTRALVIDEINSLLAGSPRQQRIFLQMLRFLSNELGMALICAGTPEARQAMLTDPQLRSRFLDIELPLWRDDGDLRTFLARLVQSSPIAPSLAGRLTRSATTDCDAFGGADLDHLQGIRTGRRCGDCIRRGKARPVWSREPGGLARLGRSWDNCRARAGSRRCRSTA